MRACGLDAELSDDAGDYICNETLYLALGSDVPRVGFIHVPMPSERMSLQKMTDGLADVLHLIF
jgi:pyrrolidone-carboxylate peptidase